MRLVAWVEENIEGDAQLLPAAAPAPQASEEHFYERLFGGVPCGILLSENPLK
jgi:hypothetical protein